MSHDLTLPPIPGLVRRTTPMVDDYGRRGVVSALTAHDWTIALDDIDEQPKRAIGPLPIVGWSVDLTDATGRTHAGWWWRITLHPDLPWRANPEWGGGYSLEGLANYAGDGRYRDLLADLDPNDDTRLPDGSRRVDAEALRRVVLHVAGVTNG